MVKKNLKIFLVLVIIISLFMPFISVFKVRGLDQVIYISVNYTLKYTVVRTFFKWFIV